MSVQEAQATWDMLVRFKTAIQENDYWKGTEVQAVAMGLQWVVNMETQYRGYLEKLKRDEKEALKKAKDQIKTAGGEIKNGASAVNNG